MGKSISRWIFIFASVFYILYVTLPLVGQVLPLSIQYVSIVVIVVIVLFNLKVFNNRATIWLLIYLAVLTIYVLLGKSLTISSMSDEKGNLFKLFMEMAFILPSFAIMNVVNYYNDKRINKILFITAIIGLGISFLYLIPLTITNSNILRMAMKAEMYDMDSVLGAPRYSLMHAYIIIAAPALLACLLFNGKMKAYFIAFFAMLVYMILRSYIATTILLLLGVIAVAYLRGSGNRSDAVVRSITVAVILLVFVAAGGLQELYDTTSGFFEGSYAESKFEQLGMALSGDVSDENSLSERQNLHYISLRSFLANPIFGEPVIGGHSNFLDRLGGMGVVCFVPYLMLLISIWKIFRRKLRGSPRTTFYYNIGCIVVFILLYEKGIFSYEGWTFYAVILPVFALYLSKKENSLAKVGK